MGKKVLLVDPPFQKFMNFSKSGIPLGLLYIAGDLKNKGDEVSVFDADYNPNGIPYPFIGKIEHYQDYLNGLHNSQHILWKNIKKLMISERPDVVGISIISTKLHSALRVAEIAKNLGIKVVAGGPHVTLHGKDIIKSPYIDAVVMGEGEGKFDEALSRKGIINAPRIENLDSLAWPARESLIGLEKYKPKDLGMIITSRGCPNSCNFCCSEPLWGKKVRKRSISDVIKEMDSVKEKYGTREFYIIDDTFTLGRKRVEEFCELVKEREYNWNCLTRADKVNKGLIKKMLSSGCKVIKIGVESGNDQVLKMMNKRVNTLMIQTAAEILNENNVSWVAYIMAGSPGETKEQMYDTIRFVQKISPTFVSASIYTPYPGTGFEKGKYDAMEDHAIDAANHHSLEYIRGEVPREDLIHFMKFADEYNQLSKLNLAKKNNK